MRFNVSQRFSARFLAKGLLTVAAASLLAACSNSVERFQEASNPSDADPVYTASVPKSVQQPTYRKKRPVIEAPDVASDEEMIIESPVARAPLPKAQQAPSYDYAQSYKKTYRQPQLAAPKPKYEAPSYDDADVAETAQPVVRKSLASSSGVVTVGQGMTLYSIARANDVDAMELAAYNKMKAPYHVWSGQKLKIPGTTEARLPEASAAPVRKIALADDEPVIQKPVARKTAGSTHTVASGETLYSLGRTYGVSPFVIAEANGLDHNKGLSIGQKIKIPGSKNVVAQAETETEVAPLKKPTQKKAPLSLAEDEETTAADSTDVEPIEQPKQLTKVTPAKPAAETTVAQVPASNALNLRWPLKGKVISTYGPKNNGLKNEGINIAVPEGTSVRAAEGGVVAYAGNELKGYGNLVLIRHQGGYVTAYAHAKELLVKRGDTVERGGIIGKAGQTGSVSSPQLHFEVRKGATALDPNKYLTSTTASN
jgi:murein DD-endopeptidase MepM/ murein hydrolase activator NlpD